MRLHFLGGADEVGASCLVVETARHRILVDAGIRPGAAQADRLPDLARLGDLGGIDEVLVTHAHLDHTGALPLVHAAFPAARVWLTEPTLALLRILLLDAVRVMETRSEQEGEIPLYPPAAVEALLARARGVRLLEPVTLCGGAVRATFFPAGHVLGAAAIGLETPEGRVLVTGDLSVVDQLTVSGMPRPRFAPDVVVCESTYGARLHASRRAEEERLADTVLEVLRGGGKVLIPAFALGRAQEVLLVLRRALARAGAPPVTVVADGMVRSVCAVYAQQADYLAPSLRRRAQDGRGPFFTADGRIRQVAAREEREAIVTGGPCVIVASSGMLAGGPSAWYAARLAADERAMIAITGYQDEEAPGRRLQELARGASRELVLEGRPVAVRCRVESYALSAHADAHELAGLVASLAPREVMLVHGAADARQGLCQALFDRGCRRVHLPATGDVIAVEAAPPRPPRAVTGLGGARALDREALGELHRHLWLTEPRGRTYAASDLAAHWYGSAAVPAELGPLGELLRSAQPLFVPDGKRPFLYRCADPQAPAALPAAAGAPRDETGRLEQNAALALCDALFGPEAGLYRKGAERETWTLRLGFHFPDVAQRRFVDELAALAEQSGWTVAVHPEAHLAALAARAQQLLGDAALAGRAPSVHTDLRVVRVVVTAAPDPAAFGAAASTFRRETGFELELRVGTGTGAAKRTFDERGRMEINLALGEIERTFAGREPRPYRKSKRSGVDGELIELAFVSPEVGARCQAVIADLEYRTSWPIRIAASVDQQAVLRLAKELLPPGWQVTKGPGLDVAGRTVKMRLMAPPPAEERARVGARLAELTGFALAVEPR